MPPRKNLDLNIEVDVLTSGSVADIVNAIFEFLLFQRNQIPFVYSTYKYYVTMWSEEKEADTDAGTQLESSVNTLYTFQLDRQREQALHTKDAISAMRKLIKKSFEKNTVRCLRFLFGSTSFTPKEAYTIHIPIESISRMHFDNQHRIPHTRLNQTLISLLTSEDLYSNFSQSLSPTNLYLEIEMLCDPNDLQDTSTTAQLIPKDVCELPPSCKDIHFHLLHKPSRLIDDGLTLNCCKELEVFNGIMCLNLKEDEKRSRESSCKEQKESACSTWWEADILVRGFKEKPIKGLSIWKK